MGTYTLEEIGDVFNKRKFKKAYAMAKQLNQEALDATGNQRGDAAYWVKRSMIEQMLDLPHEAKVSFDRARRSSGWKHSMELDYVRDQALALIRKYKHRTDRTMVVGLIEPMEVSGDPNDRPCREMILGRLETEYALGLSGPNRRDALERAIGYFAEAERRWASMHESLVNKQWRVNNSFHWLCVRRLCQESPDIVWSSVVYEKSVAELYAYVKVNDVSSRRKWGAWLIVLTGRSGLRVVRRFG